MKNLLRFFLRVSFAISIKYLIYLKWYLTRILLTTRLKCWLQVRLFLLIHSLVWYINDIDLLMKLTPWTLLRQLLFKEIIDKIIHDTIMYEFIYLEIISLYEILFGMFNLFLSKSKGVFFSPVGNVKSNFIANDWRLKKISPGNKKNERNFFLPWILI